jgi:hypothetical protein
MTPESSAAGSSSGVSRFADGHRRLARRLPCGSQLDRAKPAGRSSIVARLVKYGPQKHYPISCGTLNRRMNRAPHLTAPLVDLERANVLAMACQLVVGHSVRSGRDRQKFIAPICPPINFVTVARALLWPGKRQIQNDSRFLTPILRRSLKLDARKRK